MASLTNTKIKDTYDGLLKTTDNDALGGTYKLITDGLGNSSGVYLGTGGNVGIGTNQPQTLVQLSNNNSSTNSEQGAISFAGDTATRYSQISGFRFNNSNQAGLDFKVYNGSLNNAMRIKNDGNVGIGTTDPQSKLQVQDDTANCFIRVRAGTTSIAGIEFGDSDDIDIAGIRYSNFSNNMRFNVNGSEHMRIQSSGNVLIGKTSAGVNTAGVELNPVGYVQASRDGNLPLLVNRLTSDGTMVSIRRDNVQRGSISVSGSTTSYNTSSDYRLKENVVDMTGALDRVEQLQPKRFNFISNAETTVDGFIAHEVQSVIPEAITGEKDAVDEDGNPEYQGIDQSKIVPLLVGAIKELKAEIETLKSQINS